jgi:hypothetical protein
VPNRDRKLPSTKHSNRDHHESNHHLEERKSTKPRNVVKKFAFATRVGFQPGNSNKVNQDSFLLAPNIKGRPALHVFGVCDGHGNNGRDASNFVKFALPIAVEEGMDD